MTISAFLVHFGNFLAPALVTAGILALIPVGPRQAGLFAGYGRRFALLFAVGAAVLVVGLLLFSRDGRMATYALLALAQGTLLWGWEQRAHRQPKKTRRVRRS
ncbi:hypothetical protein NBRC116584_32430 [Hydrogenophaga sp. 5NK40-0174]